MSNTKPLTERLRTDAIFDNTTLGNEAADALEAQALQLVVQAGSIEAVQAANQRLAAEVAEHKENAMRNARIAVSIRAERDALQSKVDAMGKGEPVGYVGAGYLTLGEGRISEYATDVYKVPVYAAPKALAPLPKEAYTAIAHRTASKYTHRSDPTHIVYTFFPHTLDDFVRKVEAAHGIGGTP